MLTQPIHDRRAWTAQSLDDRTAWTYRIPRSCLAVLEQTIHDLRPLQRAPQTVALRPGQFLACVEGFAPVLAALEDGRGFVILEGLGLEEYTPDEAQVLYWLTGQVLGQPLTQNVEGTLLYDVRDYGRDVAQGARFSVTSAESTFHTDNSFGEGLDYVGLLCLNPALRGGLSQLVSGYSVHNVLLEENPEALEILYRPFHVDRRGGIRAGEPPTVQAPILNWDGAELTIRYLRYWIEAGQQKVGQPLTAAQLRALDALDEAARRPELRAEFALERGQILFANNRWTLHNRTAFEDHSDLERRRHLVRLWLQRREREEPGESTTRSGQSREDRRGGRE